MGLANIRDRLAQAYGEDHLFEIRTPARGGFTVVIEMPYETPPSKTRDRKLRRSTVSSTGASCNR